MFLREDLEARFRFENEKENGEDQPMLYVDAKLDGQNFTTLAKRYPGKKWINLVPGFRVSGSEPGGKRNQLIIEPVPVLHDDRLFVSHSGHVVLEDGTTRTIDLDVTVGMIRRWRDDPHPCQCD